MLVNESNDDNEGHAHVEAEIAAGTIQVLADYNIKIGRFQQIAALNKRHGQVTGLELSEWKQDHAGNWFLTAKMWLSPRALPNLAGLLRDAQGSIAGDALRG